MADEDFENIERDALQIELKVLRKQLNEKHEGRALRSVMIDLSAIVNNTNANEVSDEERVVAVKWATQFRRIIGEQGQLP